VTERQLGRLPSGVSVTVSVHRYVGGSGPTAYVQAGQHGIELNGPVALRHLHSELIDAEIAGTVVVVPLVNSPAFDHRRYMIPPDFDARNANLNRVWPGDADGSLGERLVAGLWELVTDADAAIDLHTGTADMLEHVRLGADRADARRLGEAFGTDYLLTDDESSDADSGKFRIAATREDIPAITVELGNSRQVDPEGVETGVEGMCDVLREIGILDGHPTPTPNQQRLRDDPEETRTTVSGVFEPRPDIAVGDRIETGDHLGTVYCPSSFERREAVTATAGGVVYSLTREGTVVSGEGLASVARRI